MESHLLMSMCFWNPIYSYLLNLIMTCLAAGEIVFGGHDVHVRVSEWVILNKWPLWHTGLFAETPIVHLSLLLCSCSPSPTDDLPRYNPGQHWCMSGSAWYSEQSPCKGSLPCPSSCSPASQWPWQAPGRRADNCCASVALLKLRCCCCLTNCCILMYSCHN